MKWPFVSRKSYEALEELIRVRTLQDKELERQEIQSFLNLIIHKIENVGTLALDNKLWNPSDRMEILSHIEEAVAAITKIGDKPL